MAREARCSRCCAQGRVVLDGSALDDPGLRIPLAPDLSERMRVNGEAAGSAARMC